MSEQVLISTVRIQTKTSWEWELSNPIIALGYGAYSSDTRELRIGDGTKTWSELEGNSPLLATPPHASIHSTSGRDPITPAAIGAATTSHTHTPEECNAAPLDEYEKIPLQYLPDLDVSQIVSGVFTPARLPAASVSGAGISQLNNTVTSTSTVQSLTAAQGKVLKDLVDTKQNNLGFTPENAVNKNQASGYAGLDASGKILENLLPSLAISDVYEASSSAAMVLLAAQKGDVCIRTDINKSFILSTNNPGTLSDWKELRTPTDAVLSVAGKTGVVVLETADLTESTNKYFVSSTEKSNWNAAKTHADSAHAPSNAQKNSDITKAEIEAKLTGNITSHAHSSMTTDLTITKLNPLIYLQDTDTGGLTRAVANIDAHIGFLNSSGAWSMLVDNSGNLTAIGNVTAYSDIRLKTDLTKITNALEKVFQISGYTFRRVDTEEIQAGLIAQEVQKVLPEAVKQHDEYLSLGYGNVLALIVEAIKELAFKVDRIQLSMDQMK